MLKQQVSWKKQNKQLDEDAQTNIQLKKQINKQSDMDSLIQNSINDKIYQLKLEATILTKKMENQKYKNLQLQTIIKTIKCRIEDDKKTQANSVTDINFQNIQSLQRKIKKYQYDLDQTNSKANKISSIVAEKKHKISLLRTQRVIDSSIFRNIEKQLIDSQMEFKKLLIQKIKNQKAYEQSLNEYNGLKNKAQQYFQSQQTARKYQIQTQNANRAEQIFDLVNDNKNNKFKEIERQPSQYYRNTTVQSDFRKQEQNLYYEFKVKKLLMNLNIANGKQFVYVYHNLDKINDKYFQTLNKEGDQITRLEEEIKKMQKTIQQNTIQFYKPKPALSKSQQEFLNCHKLKKSVAQSAEQTQKQVQSLNQFMEAQNFSKFIKYLDLEGQLVEDMDLQSLMQFLKNIQQKMNNLNIYQVPKLTEQSIIIKTGRTEKQKKSQKLEDLMNRVKVYEQSDKIMKREQFKEEYRKILQNGPVTGSRPMIKKKTRKVIM